MNGLIRTVAAVIGAIIYPGVGHLVLRAWRRAFAWFGISFLTAYVAILLSDVPVSELRTVEDALEIQAMLPWQATAAILFVSVLGYIAFRTGLVGNRLEEEIASRLVELGDSLEVALLHTDDRIEV